jgi:hypothetical protein
MTGTDTFAVEGTSAGEQPGGRGVQACHTPAAGAMSSRYATS